MIKTFRKPPKPPMVKSGEPGPRPDEQQLGLMIQMELKKRAAICGQEIDAVLAKHGCILVGIPGFTADPDGRWRLGVNIKAQAQPKGNPKK